MDKDKIIKAYERKFGYGVCYWCAKIIKAGDRIVFHREEINPYRLYKIGAICLKCFNKYTKKMQND